METLSRLRISDEDKAEVAEFVEAYAQLNKAEQSEFWLHHAVLEPSDCQISYASSFPVGDFVVCLIVCIQTSSAVGGGVSRFGNSGNDSANAWSGCIYNHFSSGTCFWWSKQIEQSAIERHA